MSAPPEILSLLQPPDDFDARPVVERLVVLAFQEGASDLHLRPNREEVEVLLRCDGVLRQRFGLPLPIYPRLLVGLKNLARLASYKKSSPQDGQMEVAGQEVRVAVAPGVLGEKVVLRLLGGHQDRRELHELGLEEQDLARLRRMVSEPQGLVLTVGPAGSGKTTTLFAAIEWRYREHAAQLLGARLNVVTLEDPVELVIPEFTQTQIQPGLGMTFASGLRSLLRQDPEVILVGEIRDEETAAATVQCSLTGHLVLSTLHARDALGVVPRLLEMGVQPYMLGASLLGVVYQRLLRRLCPECRAEAEDPGGDPGNGWVRERARFGLGSGPAWRAVGCEDCAFTGYRGRLAVAEVLEVSEEIRQGILDRQSLSGMRALAVAQGMQPLRKAALLRVAQGVTSYQEVCRVIPGPSRAVEAEGDG